MPLSSRSANGFYVSITIIYTIDFSTVLNCIDDVIFACSGGNHCKALVQCSVGVHPKKLFTLNADVSLIQTFTRVPVLFCVLKVLVLVRVLVNLGFVPNCV